jgi:hypothetical protein
LLPPKTLLLFCRQKSSQNTKHFNIYNINAQQCIARSYGKKKEVATKKVALFLLPEVQPKYLTLQYL